MRARDDVPCQLQRQRRVHPLGVRVRPRVAGRDLLREQKGLPGRQGHRVPQRLLGAGAPTADPLEAAALAAARAHAHRAHASRAAAFAPQRRLPYPPSPKSHAHPQHQILAGPHRVRASVTTAAASASPGSRASLASESIAGARAARTTGRSARVTAGASMAAATATPGTRAAGASSRPIAPRIALRTASAATRSATATRASAAKTARSTSRAPTGATPTATATRGAAYAPRGTRATRASAPRRAPEITSTRRATR